MRVVHWLGMQVYHYGILTLNEPVQKAQMCMVNMNDCKTYVKQQLNKSFFSNSIHIFFLKYESSRDDYDKTLPVWCLYLYIYIDHCGKTVSYFFFFR